MSRYRIVTPALVFVKIASARQPGQITPSDTSKRDEVLEAAARAPRLDSAFRPAELAQLLKRRHRLTTADLCGRSVPTLVSATPGRGELKDAIFT